jgi:hypothetical protein
MILSDDIIEGGGTISASEDCISHGESFGSVAGEVSIRDCSVLRYSVLRDNTL